MGQLTDGNLTIKQKQISFHFNLINFPTNRNTNYRYKINDGDWIQSNQVVLQSMRPGVYEITMECLNKENKSISVKYLPLTVHPPFWMSPWFVSSSVILMTLCIISFLRWRIRKLKGEHEERTRLVITNSELQLRSLQIQMNPHFIFNALSGIQNFIISKKTEESLRYLGDLASIIRTNLENASEEYVSLKNEIEFLEKYADIEKMRFNNSLKISFINNVRDSDIMIPPMLIQPLIENAVKHGIRAKGHVGSVNVEFDQTGVEILSVIVEDNGIGREAAATLYNKDHNGRGLKIIRQRLDLLNSLYHTDQNTISIIDLFEDGTPAGTKIILNLVIRRS